MAWHKIRRNHSNSTPSNVIVVSVAGNKSEPAVKNGPKTESLSCGYCRFARYEGIEPTRELAWNFTNGGSFWGWVNERLDKQRLTWIVGIDLPRILGLTGFWTGLERGEWFLDSPGQAKQRGALSVSPDGLLGGLFVINDPPIIIGIRNLSGERALIVDLRNYQDLSIADIADNTGYKLPDVVANDSAVAEQLPRLRTEVSAMQDYFSGLCEFFRVNDFGLFRWTAGGCSMSAFRHKYMSHDIVCHDDMEVRALERTSYYGGNIRIFRMGKYTGGFTQLDITSLFPYVMQNMWFPAKLAGYVSTVDWQAGPPPGEPLACCAEVALDSPTIGWSQRTKSGNQLSRGRVITVLAGPELDFAISRGLVVGWRRCAEYKMAPIFREFVNGLWPLRQLYQQQSNKLGDGFVKMLLNSLYGKWGQFGNCLVPRPDKMPTECWEPWTELCPDTKEVREFISVGYQVFECTKSDNKSTAFPAISSWVTSYARLYMNTAIEVAGSLNVFYQAVDSLIVNEDGFSRLADDSWIKDKTIGKFRIEAASENINIVGNNHYNIGAKRVEGWHSLSAENISLDMWQQWEKDKLRTQIARKPDQIIRYRPTIKTPQPSILGYHVCHDKTTRPYNCIDWEGDLPSQDDSAMAKLSPTSSIRSSIVMAPSVGSFSTASTTD